MTKKIFKTLLLITTLVFVISSCTVEPGPAPGTQVTTTSQIKDSGEPKSITENLTAQSNIIKFANYDDLKTFLAENAVDSYYNYGRGGMSFMDDMMVTSSMDMAEESAPQAMEKSAGLAAEGGGGGSEDFSLTNIQVEGVDEADIIKTDGEYIYAVSNQNLFIIKAYPADKAEILAKIEFKSYPSEIYINGDYLVVYGRDDQIYDTELYSRFKRYSDYTFFKVFDIKDRKDPKQIRDMDIEGYYTNSRMIGDYVYLVTNAYNYYYIEEEPIIPRIIDDGEVMANDCEKDEKCFMPDVYYFDIPYHSYDFTTVTAINVTDEEEPVDGDVYLMSSNQNIYVSQDNIYITYTKYIDEYELEMEVMQEIVYPLLDNSDKEKIANIEKAEKYILSPDEKRWKIEEIVQRYIYSLNDDKKDDLEKEVEEKMKKKYEDISKELEKTVIHKIAIDEGELTYKTHGEVTGYVINQFAMDENEGYFRIATTKSPTWSSYVEENQQSYSNLYVLDEDLKVVGAVEDLAKDEKIYSVRFMQNKAYLVTFKQMDPLFVIDLADPTKPKVLGELKIPGYSNYLHPYDENTLIGFGRETGESEWGGVVNKGLKLSLFDVSDFDNPKEVDTYVLGDENSYSTALDDHRAFLFSKEKNLLVIPATITSSLEARGWGEPFRGAVVFKVDEKGFELAGKINHADGNEQTEDYWWGYDYDTTVKRTLYIDDILYTYSNKYIKMNDLEDLVLVDTLELIKEEPKTDDDFVIVN